MRLVVALGRRLRETNERLTRQSFQTVQSRVAVVLGELVARELAERRNQEELEGVDEMESGPIGSSPAGQGAGASADEPSPVGDVLVTATQSDVAQLAGSSRESASRFLAVLERAGVISQGRGRLVVHDPEALKQYVF